MISLLGRGLVLAALFFAAAGCFAGFWAGSRKNERAWEWTRNSAYGFAGSIILANLVMVYALVTHDFSVSYVAEVGSRSTPLYFTIVSLWASLNGSILFWGGILGVYTALTVYSLGDRHREYAPWALHVLMGISIFFCFLVASIANPFAPVANPPLDGPGPNPLLQNHWLMAVHPPMLYLGYVGMSVPFSLICAALLAGRLEAGWMVPVRRWMLIPWMFLTFGIVLGGWWSYAVLGWGGAWAWDPVENASFHPWLTGTAFIHSAMVLQRKGKLRDWTLILGMSTFLLTLLGTFMTRSGVFNSVHSFTQSNIGPVFLGFIAFTFIYSVVLLALRSHILDEEASANDRQLGNKSDRVADFLSRDTAILLQNATFAAFTFMVLLGTLYPLLAEALQGKRLSVGEPYFDKFALPLGLVLVFLMGVGPALPWGRAAPEVAQRRLGPPVLVGGLFALAAMVGGITKPMTVVTLGLIGFALWSNLYEIIEPVWQRMRARDESLTEAFPRVWAKAYRRFGGHIAHYGVLCAVFALAMTKGYRVEREVNMDTGDVVEFQGYDITFAGARDASESHRQSTLARFEVEGIGAFEPRLNYYGGRMAGNPIFTPAVRSTVTSDLYFSILQVSPDKSNVIVRLIHEPFQSWLWISAPIIMLGTIIALIPSARSSRRPRAAPSAAEGVSS